MTHTDDALTEAVAKAMYEMEPSGEFLTSDPYPMGFQPYTWEDMRSVEGSHAELKAQARVAIAAVRQFDEQSALNCGHCTPNTDEIACACQIKERDDE